MKIHHIALRVTDLERSRRFYHDVLGLELVTPEEQRSPSRSLWLRAGDVVLMLEPELRGRGAEKGSGHVLSFAVEELEELEARLLCAGVSVDDRTEKTLFVRDPDGHRVGLSSFAFPA